MVTVACPGATPETLLRIAERYGVPLVGDPARLRQALAVALGEMVNAELPVGTLRATGRMVRGKPANGRTRARRGACR